MTRTIPRDRRSIPISSNVQRAAEAAQESCGGLLRLAPCWVPRSFLQPGKRLRLDPRDLYACGLHRGGIDERWFASTVPAFNPDCPPDEGLSYVVANGERFTLKDAVDALGPALVGDEIWKAYKRWPVFAKLFDNSGPIPMHLHQDAAHAALAGREAKPEAYYFPPQYNSVTNSFPYTFFGLNPGTTKAQVRRCLEDWDKGDNGILDLSSAHRLKIGTGWLVGTGILHAPGSLCTYEPQWGSDVFAIFQSLVEGREVPWSLLVRDVPRDRHTDLDFMLELLDWDANLDPNFKRNHHLEPIATADTMTEGYVDRWVVYGRFQGRQLFTAKELTVAPGVTCTIRDHSAYGLTVMQGQGRMNNLRLSSPTMIGYHELTEDEVFAPAPAARAGVTFENTSELEPLVALRYFGPEAHPDAPEIG